MCGIVGFTSETKDINKIDKFTADISHRGPDSSNYKIYKVGNKYILVNKGFTLDKYIKKNNEKNIEGIIIKIPKPKFFELENDFKNNKWYTLSKKDIEKKTGLKLTPYIVYKQNIIKATNSVAVKPNLISKVNHLNYAMTWFFLSITLCVIFSVYYNKNSSYVN